MYSETPKPFQDLRGTQASGGLDKRVGQLLTCIMTMGCWLSGVMFTCDAFGMHYCAEDVFDSELGPIEPHYRYFFPQFLSHRIVSRQSRKHCAHEIVPPEDISHCIRNGRSL